LDLLGADVPVAKQIDPSESAKAFRADVRARVAQSKRPLTLVGLLPAEAGGPSVTYANYTRVGCEDVGIRFDLRRVPKLDFEAAIERVNADPAVDGIIVYYPVFATEHDRYLKDLVDHRKDIEGLNTFWARKLYRDERFVDDAGQKKSILPCTPLAVMKLLEESGIFAAEKPPLAGKVVTVFNRSEVVGRPLAHMLANDGAQVFSFDIDGPLEFRAGGIVAAVSINRAAALGESDAVITGVPSREFPLVTAGEIKRGAVCVNFSTMKNFADDVQGKASVFVPRVGPMTVAMALRNTLRLSENYRGDR
jgi:methylenetetrahydrofolate dehydrogenase (NADP+)/methenyltetrahydrofolate cyclohydrolase